MIDYRLGGMRTVDLLRPLLYIGKIANFDTRIAMRVHVLALNGVFDTGLSAVLDAFGTANALAEMTGISSLRFQIKGGGLRKSITPAHGLNRPGVSANRAQTPDAGVRAAR